MSWNYRMVDAMHLNGGEPCVQMAEVFYDDDGSPIGYSFMNFVGGDNAEDLQETVKMMGEAFNKPIMRYQDFFKTRKRMMEILALEIEDKWGPKCSDYEPDCCVCKAYARLSEIPFPANDD